jgi:flagellar hook protein FlgE
MRSLYAAVSGLQMDQQAMDVIGNNIANSNTTGFKQSNMTFTELFAQTLRGASAPTATVGGTNPAQVGLGTALGSIETDQSQGSLQTTGNSTDMAIQGNGLFVLDNGTGGQLYTRDGSFIEDGNGNLVDATTGNMVMGWMATTTTAATPTPLGQGPLTDISIPVTQTLAPEATTSVTYGGNLTVNGTTATVPVTVYDSLGDPIQMTLTFTPTTTGNWSWAVSATATSPTTTGGTTPVSLTTSGTGSLVFNTAGVLTSGGTGTITITDSVDGTSITLNPDFSQLTGYAQPSSVTALTQNGYVAGSLESYTIDNNGVITGVFTNGHTTPIAQIALAAFSNPGGLQSAGNGIFTASNNSGLAQVGQPNSGGRGTVASGSLEQSNVDLAANLTNMIVVQNAFQANSQVIKTADQLLQTLAQI